MMIVTHMAPLPLFTAWKANENWMTTIRIASRRMSAWGRERAVRKAKGEAHERRADEPARLASGQQVDDAERERQLRERAAHVELLHEVQPERRVRHAVGAARCRKVRIQCSLEGAQVEEGGDRRRQDACESEARPLRVHGLEERRRIPKVEVDRNGDGHGAGHLDAPDQGGLGRRILRAQGYSPRLRAISMRWISLVPS